MTVWLQAGACDSLLRLPHPPLHASPNTHRWQVSQPTHTASSSSFSPWQTPQAPQASAAAVTASLAATLAALTAPGEAPSVASRLRAARAASRAAELAASRHSCGARGWEGGRVTKSL